jgi:hypothetical protein
VIACNYEETKERVMTVCESVLVGNASYNPRILHLAQKGNDRTCCGQLWTRRAWFRKYQEMTGCSACLVRGCELDPPYRHRLDASRAKFAIENHIKHAIDDVPGAAISRAEGDKQAIWKQLKPLTLEQREMLYKAIADRHVVNILRHIVPDHQYRGDVVLRLFGRKDGHATT